MKSHSPTPTPALINLPAFLEWLKEENPGWQTSVAQCTQQEFKVRARATRRKTLLSASRPLSTMDRAHEEPMGWERPWHAGHLAPSPGNAPGAPRWPGRRHHFSGSSPDPIAAAGVGVAALFLLLPAANPGAQAALQPAVKGSRLYDTSLFTAYAFMAKPRFYFP